MRIKGNSMLLKKTVFILIILLLTSVSALWAGDSAVFVDLGFSQDGRMYMFGQYGVLSPSLRPWADIYVVDVARNVFAQNGRVSLVDNSPIKAGQDGSGTLHRLVANNSTLSNRYFINFQNQGLPLYISRDENPPSRGETIDFRDFLSGKSYKAQLISTITGNGQTAKSQFFINLEVNSPNSQCKTYKVGTPNFTRQGIVQYNFKRVLIDTTGSSVIFVIEMMRASNNGVDIRYMVEAVRL
jgi:predicted secreted protein